MVEHTTPEFDVASFLRGAGLGRRIVQLAPKQPFFSQGDPADAVFYLQQGRARVTVVSAEGKEATITLLGRGDFVGEEALATMGGKRLSTATSIGACTALKINRDEMIRVMQEERDFSALFLKFLLERSMRIQADLVDQLFNSSEKRLARILLLMAEFGKPSSSQSSGVDQPLEDSDETVQYIPKVSQETLAEMIGTTRSRVSFFMNRFRKLGFIKYNGGIQVHRSLLNVILHDQLPDDEARKPSITGIPAE
jgi:CRP/FNR family cyclic AMP-dependent transcriptional regulator